LKYRNYISKEDIYELPLIKYEGDIALIDTHEKLEWAVHQCMQHNYLGFDMEKRPSFRKGEYYPICLIQIAIPEKVFLFRINITGFHQTLVELFETEEISKVGISVKNDIRELNDLKAFEPKNIKDLNIVAKDMGINCSGVKKLAGIFLNGRISKKMQTSNWENKILTEAQQLYAATDAWVCYSIFKRLTENGYVFN